jgi:hypothetical protein
VIGENPLEMFAELAKPGKSTAEFDELVVIIAHELPRTPAYTKATRIGGGGRSPILLSS